jgi:POT family proton-dependent oligopeptide transporter
MPRFTFPRFPREFYIANVLEIFERLAWYGFFTVSSLYITAPQAQGGLGLTDSDRGFLQGIIPFILYLLPVLTGALADQYGYRKFFIISLSVLATGYFVLGQAQHFWSFTAAFTLVAIGAAIFKPVVIGTVGRATDADNRGMGFGIFYTMVNIGGFAGPLVAGYMRAISWDMVFIMSSAWCAIALFIALILFPAKEKEDGAVRSPRIGLSAARSVLGNGRLLLLSAGLLVVLLVHARGMLGTVAFFTLGVVWGGVNLVWNRLAVDGDGLWWRQRIKVGQPWFLAFLLIMAGFWSVYNQIFLTLPLHIRDSVDTGDLVRVLKASFPSTVDYLSRVNIDLVQSAINRSLFVRHGDSSILSLQAELASLNVRAPASVLTTHIDGIRAGGYTVNQVASKLLVRYRQINPEYIVNTSFGLIIAFQLLISTAVNKRDLFGVMKVGMLILAGAMLLFGMAHQAAIGGTILMLAITVFAVAEMLTSPKSQEYVAALAPRDQTAMYMGFYFLSMALGSLFGGLLSGWSYQVIARDLGRPDLMWMLFGTIALANIAALVVLQRRTSARRHA